MMRVPLLVMLLAACGSSSEVGGQERDATEVGVTAVQDRTTTKRTQSVDFGQAVTFEPLTVPDALPARYIDAMCKLYTEPACVAAQKASCNAHLAFKSADACDTFMQRTASTCQGLADALAKNAPAVDKCAAQLSAHDCAGVAPMCDERGARLDATADCAQIAAIIAACDPDEDTGQ